MKENTAEEDDLPVPSTIAQLLDQLTVDERAQAAASWETFVHMTTDIDLLRWEQAMDLKTVTIRMAIYDAGNILGRNGIDTMKAPNPFRATQ